MSEKKLVLVICLINGKFLIKSKQQVQEKRYNEAVRYSAEKWPTSILELADLINELKKIVQNQLGITEKIDMLIEDAKHFLKST